MGGIGLGVGGMDSLLLVLLFSGLCGFFALGMSAFILAASIQATRISRTEI
jgi:hypothetical protein